MHAKKKIWWMELNDRRKLSNLPKLVNEFGRNLDEKFTDKL